MGTQRKILIHKIQDLAEAATDTLCLSAGSVSPHAKQEPEQKGRARPLLFLKRDYACRQKLCPTSGTPQNYCQNEFPQQCDQARQFLHWEFQILNTDLRHSHLKIVLFFLSFFLPFLVCFSNFRYCSKKFFKSLILCMCAVCMCVRVCIYATVGMWRSEDNLLEPDLLMELWVSVLAGSALPYQRHFWGNMHECPVAFSLV